MWNKTYGFYVFSLVNSYFCKHQLLVEGLTIWFVKALSNKCKGIFILETSLVYKLSCLSCEVKYLSSSLRMRCTWCTLPRNLRVWIVGMLSSYLFKYSNHKTLGNNWLHVYIPVVVNSEMFSNLMCKTKLLALWFMNTLIASIDLLVPFP